MNFPDYGSSSNNDGFVNKNYFSTPAVNIKDSAYAFQIDLAAPGLEQQDFHLRLEKNVLTVSVNTANENNSSEGYLRQEFGFTRFERHFQLPITTDTEQIKVTYQSGVLRVFLPKAPQRRLLHFSRN